MKRGELKRKAELKRRQEFGRATDRAREAFQRGRVVAREELKRVELKRRPKKRPPEGPMSPADWRRAVFNASGGWCKISRTRARDADDRRFHAHHPLPKSELRARGYFDRVYDPRNGTWLRRGVHLRHEAAVDRVPYTELPASVWDFCTELDILEGTRWATDLVLRYHPARGERGRSHEEDTDGEGRRHRDHAEGEGRGS